MILCAINILILSSIKHRNYEDFFHYIIFEGQKTERIYKKKELQLSNKNIVQYPDYASFTDVNSFVS